MAEVTALQLMPTAALYAGQASEARLGAAAHDDPAKARDAAEQFEALLIGQILRAVRESGGWLGSNDASSDCATEYAEQQFASLIAKQGGLGLSALIAKGLERTSK